MINNKINHNLIFKNKIKQTQMLINLFIHNNNNK